MALKHGLFIHSLDQELELARQREKNAISMLEAVKSERQQLRFMVEQLTLQVKDQNTERDKHAQALKLAGILL